jgi:phosphoenolpyruvate carboxykinase (GTP)
MDATVEAKLGNQLEKLKALDNTKINDFVEKYVLHCNPDKVYVCDNSDKDIKYLRERSIELGEEEPLATEGHTIHFDGYNDQARDKAQTKYLLGPGMDLGQLNSIDKEEGLSEAMEFLKDSMVEKEMIITFFTLGPQDSIFSIPCAQITDSFYVAHSESILYRGGYNHFKSMEDKESFFRFVHTAGELDGCVSKNVDKRRILIDLQDNVVYSTNTQYAGNTVGLKKLSLRLAINKAAKEDWLAEHMFIMGAHGPGGRVTYFTGAFPSACGKTATAMIRGETIVGDDIAYLKIIDGKIRTVNVEKGIFGIIADVNSKNDPVIYDALTSPREVIFSNVLVTEDKDVYWLGKDGECPDSGFNHSGQWTKGKKDKKDNEITPSHKNARYTIAISELENRDPLMDDPNGVEVGGIIYGGRDSDTSVPVEQSFDWEHGIITKGASLESETTAATLGQEGVRKFNPMSNLDFVAVPIGQYIQMNLDFGDRADSKPPIFAVNYFLKDEDGNFMNGMEDKRVWMKWMELRVHGDIDAIKTPTGHIPKYEDLKKLFKEVLGKDYSLEDYNTQFTIRTLQLLDKIDRIEVQYSEKVKDTPKKIYEVLDAQRKRVEAAREEHGDYILPEKFA